MKNTSKTNVQPKSAEITETVDVLPDMQVSDLPTDELVSGEVPTLDELLGLSDESELQKGEEFYGNTENLPKLPEAIPPPQKYEVKNVTPPNMTEYRLKSLKRAIDHKKYSLEHERAKVEDWRMQALHRDESAHDEYLKRKTILESQLYSNENRYIKRREKTQKHWWDYCVNYESGKIAKIVTEIEVLEKELQKLELAPVVEATKTEASAPEVTAPDVSAAKLTAPELTAAELTAAELTAAELTAPEVTATELKAA